MNSHRRLNLRRRLELLRRVLLRLFLAYSVMYALFAVLFDYRSSPYPGVSEGECTPSYIGASSQADLPQHLVDEFAPTIVFSYGEPAKLEEEVVVPYQIVPDVENTGRYVYRGAVTYRLDYGATSFGVRFRLGSAEHTLLLSKTVVRVLGWIYGQAHVDSHVGDVEMFELYLTPGSSDGYWQIDSLVTYPHGERQTYTAEEVHCFRDSPILYVSRGKHAMYPSLAECNNSGVVGGRGVRLIAEQCSVGSLYYPSTSPEFNVGDSRNPVNIFATSPTILAGRIFAGEDAWGTCFYGGYGAGRTPQFCRSFFQWW